MLCMFIFLSISKFLLRLEFFFSVSLIRLIYFPHVRQIWVWKVWYPCSPQEAWMNNTLRGTVIQRPLSGMSETKLGSRLSSQHAHIYTLFSVSLPFAAHLIWGSWPPQYYIFLYYPMLFSFCWHSSESHPFFLYKVYEVRASLFPKFIPC